MMQANAGARTGPPGRWGARLRSGLGALILASVPCLALLGFGPGLAQVLTADAWASEAVTFDRPAAPAHVAARTDALTGTGSEVVVLANWEVTDCHNSPPPPPPHHNPPPPPVCPPPHQGGGGGGGGSTGNLYQAFADVADAQAQAGAALGLVNAAITLLNGNNPSNVNMAFADLRQAGIDEQRAANDLSDATTQSLNAGKTALAQTLAPLAGTQASIATQMILGAQIAAKLDPPSPSQSYVINNLLPLANQGVSNTNAAASAISPYQ